jgi:perosamine synthetase
MAKFIGVPHTVAVSSGTAALHLALEAMKLSRGQALLVPTMAFAACAEVVRHTGAIPVLVDCDPDTLNMDFNDAASKTEALANGALGAGISAADVVGVMPVHVGGLPMPCQDIEDFMEKQRIWAVEDCAHAFPAGWKQDQGGVRYCGNGPGRISCFSFYANKTLTTGEGGMVATRDKDVTERIRRMALHGLDRGTWDREAEDSPWDYKIVDRGFKYNLTDISAAIGIHQLARAEQMRHEREKIAHRYLEELCQLDEIMLPSFPSNILHSWHLFQIRLRLDKLSLSRNEFCRLLAQHGVGFSVHWRPLHLHPYYIEKYGWTPEQFPIATEVWKCLISLPIYPTMTSYEQTRVIQSVRDLCRKYHLATNA